MIPRLPGDVSFAHFYVLPSNNSSKSKGASLPAAIKQPQGVPFQLISRRELDHGDYTETIQRRNRDYTDPYPSRRGGQGGQNQPVEFHFFLLWNPGIVIQSLKWNCKVTFLNKPWALVRKYLRLAPEELSASTMTAAQFWEGCHPYTCAASVWYVLGSSGAKRKYLMFICLPMTWNDEEYWSLRKHDCKNGILKWNFSTTPPLKFNF